MSRRKDAGVPLWPGLDPALGAAVRVSLCLLLITAGPVSAADQDAPTSELPPLGVEGIARQSADDDPGVLYILPWQPPTLPRRPRAQLEDRAPDLLEPLDPIALERHRMFRETLDPSMDSSLSVP